MQRWKEYFHGILEQRNEGKGNSEINMENNSQQVNEKTKTMVIGRRITETDEERLER